MLPIFQPITLGKSTGLTTLWLLYHTHSLQGLKLIQVISFKKHGYMIMWQCKELRKREKSNEENCCHNRLFAVFAVTACFNAYFVYWNRSRFPRREKWGLCIHYLGALEITLMKRTWVENLSVTHLETSTMLFTAYFRAHNMLVAATF